MISYQSLLLSTIVLNDISCYLHFGGEKVANYGGNQFLMWLG